MLNSFCFFVINSLDLNPNKFKTSLDLKPKNMKAIKLLTAEDQKVLSSILM